MARKVREYYSSPSEKFSSLGDFFTAPELDRAFGEAVAGFAAPLLESFDIPRILELGAGRGILARDILLWLRENKPDLYGSLEYLVYDISPTLVGIQKKVLRGFPVRWVDEIPVFEGVVIANEFFDALPVHVVMKDRELYINETGEEVWLNLDNERIREFVERMGYGNLEQRIEVPLDSLDFIELLARRLIKGYVLIIDYGYTSDEVVKFPEGTIMGYKKHRAVSYIISEEEMDITAHVNFSALMEYAKDAGFKVVLFDSQRNFLSSSPVFMDTLYKLSFDESPEGVERLSRLKTMLISMGDRFRVLMFSKGF